RRLNRRRPMCFRRNADPWSRSPGGSMDFAFSPEQEALRREVLAFIAEHMTPEVVAEIDAQAEGSTEPGRSRRHRGPQVAELYRKIAERGWLGIAYPREYGGQGGDRVSQYIVEEEFMRAGISVGLMGSGAPAILAVGT